MPSSVCDSTVMASTRPSYVYNTVLYSLLLRGGLGKRTKRLCVTTLYFSVSMGNKLTSTPRTTQHCTHTHTDRRTQRGTNWKYCMSRGSDSKLTKKKETRKESADGKWYCKPCLKRGEEEGYIIWWGSPPPYRPLPHLSTSMSVYVYVHVYVVVVERANRPTCLSRTIYISRLLEKVIE